MRTNKLHIYMHTIVSCVASVIYEMAPFSTPRNMDKIMSHVISNTLNSCIDTTEHRYIATTTEEFNIWISNMLMSCKQFRELNLSHNEVQQGVDVDDEGRPDYCFGSGFGMITIESMKDDFIDLDACIRNIINSVYYKQEETTCFLCENCNTEICNQCTLNRNYVNHYSIPNRPCAPDEYQDWCKYGCELGRAICCKDCDIRNDCKYICADYSNGDCKFRVFNPDYKGTTN